ncbi:MAG: DUF3644 domain-containing protein [Lachnospiraceae bacterium]|nr:DUF3644 domain-containing protein [Lachnospiraceae bacterium]
MKKIELITKSREAMMSAVQIYNNPQITFKAETFISLAIISWTYLMHAYYANIGVNYRYFKQQGKRKIYDRTKYGAYKHWELEACLNNKNNPLDEETTSNLKFLIGIRHEIEHQMTNKIDASISAKLQACSINYNYYIKKLIGEEYGVDRELSLVVQFSPITPTQKDDMMNNDKLTNNVKNFISEFEDNLSDEEIRSQKYAYRLLFTPLSANRKGQADQVIEFIGAGTEGAEELNKAYTLIKETEKKKYRGKEIVELMQGKGYKWFSLSKMTDFWKFELGDRSKYGVYVTPDQWMWYENWIPVVEEYCVRNNDTIEPNVVKDGYYANEIVSIMVSKGYEKFTTNTFIDIWKDKMKIDKNDTDYGYLMKNNRFVWRESFLEVVELYCEEHKEELQE